MPAPNILGGSQALDLSSVSGGDWYNAPQRGIVTDDGVSIAAQVTVDEDASDDLIITEHPVEQGATINDHAFKRPAEIRVRMGWSNAWLAQPGQSGGDVKAIYEQVLALQATRLPFTVYTGKRVYQNMLIASLRQHTDAAMEFTFMADIEFREVVLVNTQAVQYGSTYNQGGLAAPESGSPTLPRGQQQTQPRVVSSDSLPFFGPQTGGSAIHVGINLSSFGPR